ncbi:MAG: hypothetical protein K8W52_40235 [Deltaproteobacteria bacterium]|nr:hypothetical protein [Deltaproteobacteria bacterium]
MTARVPWFAADLADALADAMTALEAELCLAQEPHGLDEWAEPRLQAALAGALAGRHTVLREVHYPSTAGRKRSHRPRCDLVLACAEAPQDPASAPPTDALWLELKLARQRKAGGLRDARYAQQWQRHLIADLRKLGGEPLIRDAALALVCFTEDEATLHRDLDAFEALLVRKDVVAGFRQVRALPIVERIGHRVCGVAVWPTIQP